MQINKIIEAYNLLDESEAKALLGECLSYDGWRLASMPPIDERSGTSDACFTIHASGNQYANHVKEKDGVAKWHYSPEDDLVIAWQALE